MKTAAAPRKKTLPKHSPAKGTCMMFLRINGVFYKVHPCRLSTGAGPTSCTSRPKMVR